VIEYLEPIVGISRKSDEIVAVENVRSPQLVGILAMWELDDRAVSGFYDHEAPSCILFLPMT
jgi:hypothetical protein